MPRRRRTPSAGRDSAQCSRSCRGRRRTLLVPRSGRGTPLVPVADDARIDHRRADRLGPSLTESSRRHRRRPGDRCRPRHARPVPGAALFGNTLVLVNYFQAANRFTAPAEPASVRTCSQQRGGVRTPLRTARRRPARQPESALARRADWAGLGAAIGAVASAGGDHP